MIELVAEPLGREVLWLGEHQIGFVLPYQGRGVAALWKLELPPVRRTMPLGATSKARARHELLAAAARWFEGAGLDELARQMRAMQVEAVWA